MTIEQITNYMMSDGNIFIQLPLYEALLDE